MDNLYDGPDKQDMKNTLDVIDGYFAYVTNNDKDDKILFLDWHRDDETLVISDRIS